MGGIAVTGTTGKGTWAYSLDGTTFTAVGTVAGNSALLLPKTAYAALHARRHGRRNGHDHLPGLGHDQRHGRNQGRHHHQRRRHGLQHRHRHRQATVASGSLSGYVLSRREQRRPMANSEPGIAGVDCPALQPRQQRKLDRGGRISPVQTVRPGSTVSRTLPRERIRSKSSPPRMLAIGQNAWELSAERREELPAKTRSRFNWQRAKTAAATISPSWASSSPLSPCGCSWPPPRR